MSSPGRFARLCLAAQRYQLWLLVPFLAVVPGEVRFGLVGALAEVGAVDEEALLAAEEGDHSRSDRGVWGRFEGASQAAFDRRQQLFVE